MQNFLCTSLGRHVLFYSTTPRLRERMRESAAWPHILLDPLDALDGVAEYRRRPELFPPLRTPRKRQRETVEHEGDAIVENEPGLCERMEATHAALRKLVAARTAEYLSPSDWSGLHMAQQGECFLMHHHQHCVGIEVCPGDVLQVSDDNYHNKVRIELNPLEHL